MLRKTCFVLIVLLVIPCISSAEIKTYTYTVKQPFGGSQSPDDARVAAIHKAKREVLEMAGTYIETLTVVKDHAVTKDEILALAAGVLKAEIISQESYATIDDFGVIVVDAFGVIVVAKVDVDTSILEKRVKKLLQDRTLLKKYQESQQREKELLSKIKKLEEQNLKLLTSSAQEQKQKKDKLEKQFRKITAGLTAVEWTQKAFALWKGREYSDPRRALGYLDQAIRLDPNLAIAYMNRGAVYYDLRQYQRAIGDYDQAIRLEPTHAVAYNNRAIALRKQQPCFIATVAFGSPTESHVSILRDFRDKCLVPCTFGRKFVDCYYKYSPPVADFIAKHEILKVAVRISLLPLVAVSYATLFVGPVVMLTVFAVLLMVSILLAMSFRRKVLAIR